MKSATRPTPTAIEQAGRLVNQVLLPSSIGQPQLRSVAVKPLVPELPRLLAARAEVKRQLDTLLPIEREGGEARLKEILRDQTWMINGAQAKTGRYPILSFEPLLWRDDSGYPRLVLMPVDRIDPVTLRIKSADPKSFVYEPLAGDETYREVYENVVKGVTQDVRNLLAERCPRYGEISIQASIGPMLIPSVVRDKITRARKQFGEQIFLLVEPKEWIVNRIVYPDPDPIVVGYDGQFLRRIATFDLTPVERLAAHEFVVSSAPKALPSR